MLRARARESARGFTLIETLAALLIFSLVTLGVVPLILSSMRGSAISRSYTVGRNLAQQAMERVRGFPYAVGFSTQTSKVDVLDLYYPDEESDGVYTTVCDATTTANPACPRNLADDYTVTFEARFVSPGDPTNVLQPPGEYPSNYAWNGADTPPSQLLRMNITSSWTVFGRSRSYQLETLISDRRFGDLKFSGTASIDHLVRVTGTFTDTTGAQGNLTAEIGTTASTIESKLQASAEQTVEGGTLSLVDPSSGAELAGSPITGARVSYRVPPSGNVGEIGDPVPPSTADQSNVAPTTPGSLSHGGSQIAAMANTDATGIKARIAAELPRAEGQFDYDTATPSALEFWVGDQVGLDVEPLALDPAAHTVEVHEDTVAGATMVGESAAFATALTSATPLTETSAEGSVEEIRLFPTVATRVTDRTYGGAVVVITDVRTEVRCSSTGDAASVAEATWTATLRFWNDPEDGETGGGYETVNLSGAAGTDPLEAFGAVANPLVWEKDDDDLTTAEDVYLFEAPGRPGYLQSWESEANAVADEDASGEETSARIPSAITISTVAPGASTGPLLLQVGSLSCNALEFRV